MRDAAWWVGLWGFALVLTGMPARAETQGTGASSSSSAISTSAASGDELTRAREAFLAGRKFMERGRYQEAAGAFRRAIEAKPTPGLYYHLGTSLEKSGDLVAAHASYLTAREQLETQPAPDVQALLPKALAALEAQLATIVVRPEPGNSSAELDGEPIATRREVWLRPGKHQVRVEAQGYEPVELSVQLSAGQTRLVEPRLELSVQPPAIAADGAPASAAQVTEPTDAADTTPRRPSVVPPLLLWSGTIVVAMGLGVGIGGALWNEDAKAQHAAAQEEVETIAPGNDGACAPPVPGASEPCMALRESANSQQNAAVVMATGFIAAGVGAAAAVTGLVWGHRERALRLRGQVGPGAAFLSLSGTF